MTLHPRKSPVVFSALCGWVTVAFASTLPIWVGFSFPHERLGQSLLSAIQHLLDEPELFGRELTWQQQQGNLFWLVFFYCIGGITGRTYYWWRWERRRDLPGD
jgi:hypothetical protein